MFTHLLIATDGSELASKAVATGLNLAKALNAKVTFIAVSEPRTNLFPERGNGISG
jgi:nucleotide-binding universal stress UspA family protein